MSWARYDDELSMNHKIGKLRAYGVNGIAAIGLHLLANTYCRHNGTKGVVEAHVPELLVGRSGKKLAGLLVEVGMFDPLDGGRWTIHDYAEFHDPSDPDPDKSASDRKRELSEKRAEAGRRGGFAKAGKPPSNELAKPPFASGNGLAKPQQTSSPGPDPVPSEKTGTDDDSVATPEGRSSSVEQIIATTAKAIALKDRDHPKPAFIAGIARNLRTERLDEITACVTAGLSTYDAAVRLDAEPWFVNKALNGSHP